MSFDLEAMRTIFNKNEKMIPDQFTSIFNSVGITLVSSSIFLNVKNWLLGVEFSLVLTIIISILSVFFLIMKMYDQYITTKIKKAELKQPKKE